MIDLEEKITIKIPRKGDIELAKGIRQDLEDVLTEAELLELDKIAAFKDIPLKNIEVIIAALEQYVEKGLNYVEQNLFYNKRS